MNETLLDSKKTCPCCGSNDIKVIRSRRTISDSGDRQCNACSAKWSPPSSKIVGVIMIIFCPILAILFGAMAFSEGISIVLLGGAAMAAVGFIKGIKIFKGQADGLDIYERPQQKTNQN